jgi:hypothetical protein
MAKFVTGPNTSLREAVRSITHTQSSPSTTWDITHNFKDIDSISAEITDLDDTKEHNVYDSYNIDFDYAANTVRIIWDYARTGKVKLKGV